MTMETTLGPEYLSLKDAILLSHTDHKGERGCQLFNGRYAFTLPRCLWHEAMGNGLGLSSMRGYWNHGYTGPPPPQW
ncbi:hypothetical protein N7504_004311 [Penicillium tannophilum]|nr:hypothetical protein N7504_004311 [Penicillium tannophilum]